ncbi:MAG TPA: hypothetical protein DEP20_02695 [Fusobacteria bacterium]|nr:hypothetical protein [Fusobacteriota bacterium]
MIANVLTTFRLLSIIPFYILIRNDCYSYSLFLFLLAAFTDYLDGFLARKFNQVTFMGSLLDPLADKILYLVAIFTMLEKGYISFVPISLILAREFFALGYGPTVILKKGDIFPGKLKNIFQFGSVIIVLIFKGLWVSSLAIWCSVFFTVLSGISLYLRNYKSLNRIVKEFI